MSDTDTLQVETVRMLEGVRDHIMQHAQREKDKGGYEAVGLLGGHDGEIQIVMELHNHAPDKSHAFFVEPWEQFKAEQALKSQGAEILGVYHSHPASEAKPSQSDERLAREGDVMIICSPSFGDINGWRCNNGNLHRVDLDYVDFEDDIK